MMRPRGFRATAPIFLNENPRLPGRIECQLAYREISAIRGARASLGDIFFGTPCEWLAPVELLPNILPKSFKVRIDKLNERNMW
jgi:hypothetical protein